VKLRVKLVRSPIGNTPANRRTVDALGLRKINQVVEHEDSPSIRGMLLKVRHMVEVKISEDNNASA
jgi:large subunit ribosomal protein L30